MWSKSKDEKFYKPDLSEVLEDDTGSLKESFSKDLDITDPFEYSMMGRYRIKDNITGDVRYCTKEESKSIRDHISNSIFAVLEGNTFTDDTSLYDQVVTTVEHSIISGDERVFYGGDGVIYRREDAKIPLHVVLEQDRSQGYA